MPALSTYLSLITSEYSQQPNFLAWLTGTLQLLEDTQLLLTGMPGAFSLSGAVGAQLDVIGQLVGANRDVGIPLAGGSSVLDDAHYLSYIQAKIAANGWDGTTPGLYRIWNSVFPSVGLQIIDNQNMTIQAVVTGLSDPIYADLLAAGLLVPKPAGVGLTIVGSSVITLPEYFGGLVTEFVVANLSTRAPNGFYVQTILSDSPLAYYRLDEISGTVVHDSTAGGNTGTVVGGVTLAQPGATSDGDLAESFDGETGYLDVSTSALVALGSDDDLTLEAWVFLRSLTDSESASGSGTGVTVIESNETGNAYGYCFAIDDNGHIWWWPAGGQDVHGTIAVPLNAWTHVVVVVSGGTSSLYVNGVLDTTGTTAGQPAGTFTRIGHRSWVGGWLDGRVDEVAIYSHALSAARIQAHYQAASAE